MSGLELLSLKIRGYVITTITILGNSFNCTADCPVSGFAPLPKSLPRKDSMLLSSDKHGSHARIIRSLLRALPVDVRKSSAFPTGSKIISRGFAAVDVREKDRQQRHSRHNLRPTKRKSEAFPHIERQSRRYLAPHWQLAIRFTLQTSSHRTLVRVLPRFTDFC
jgi:hypothetical protein